MYGVEMWVRYVLKLCNVAYIGLFLGGNRFVLAAVVHVIDNDDCLIIVCGLGCKLGAVIEGGVGVWCGDVGDLGA